MTWEYIAGFFDGEGCITHDTVRYRLTIAQAQQEVLEEIKDFIGFGYLIPIKKRKSHWKDSWVYYITRQEDIYSFLLSVKDRLIVKREAATKAIFALDIVVAKQQKRKQTRIHHALEVKRLREQGLTFREIGNILSIDFGYARRLSLVHE